MGLATNSPIDCSWSLFDFCSDYSGHILKFMHYSLQWTMTLKRSFPGEFLNLHWTVMCIRHEPLFVKALGFWRYLLQQLFSTTLTDTARYSLSPRRMRAGERGTKKAGILVSRRRCGLWVRHGYWWHIQYTQQYTQKSALNLKKIVFSNVQHYV